LKRLNLEKLASQNVDLAYKLWTTAAKSLWTVESHMILLGRKTALERVATCLLALDDRLESQGRLYLPMSRRDIADYLGLTLGRSDDLRFGGFPEGRKSDSTLIFGDRRWIAMRFGTISGSG
jgi:hypothetical protein